MSDDFIAWLYDKALDYFCEQQYHFCTRCPFYDAVGSCAKLTADQKREILMKIYESEVNTDASDN